jgi:hypothetical protein
MNLIDAIIAKTFLPGMLVGVISPFIAMIVAFALYVRHRERIEAERRIPALAYLFALIVAAAPAGFFGMLGGNVLACPKAGNLCGLYGVFVTGPLSFSLAIVALAVALSLVRPRYIS